MPFVKGKSGNPRGRPKVVGDLRELARRFGREGIDLLIAIARDKDQPGRARVEAVKEVLNRGFGKIVAGNDVMFLGAASQRNSDGGEVQICVAFGKPPVPLHEFANRAPEPAPPSAPRLEDLRPDSVASKRERLEEELRRSEAEISRLRAMQEQRLVDIEPTRTWPTDRQSGDGLGWPGRMGPR